MAERRPREQDPTRRPLNGGPEKPPRAPRELDPDSPATRAFEADGVAWIARRAGKGAGGTGGYGLAMVEAVHFCPATDPAKPLYEALIARGRFDALFDEELRDLLAGASRIVQTESAAPEPRNDEPAPS